jgi:glucosamine--fructose-6-phosphate aminotransferase (isomerizing)
MTTALETMIEAQPAAIEALADPALTSHAASRLAGARRIWLVGTGTSQHAAELGASALLALGVDARWMSAFAFAHSRNLLRPGDAAVVITHTGQTAYAQRSRQVVLDAGLPLVSLTGPDTTWPEAIRTPIAELSETYTVSYTTVLTVLAQLAHHLGAQDGGPDAVRATAEQVRAALADPGIDTVPMPARAMAIVGPGAWSVTAREGALKIREGARVLCDGFDPDRLLHGAAVAYSAADSLLVLQPKADPDGLTAAIADAARRENIQVETLSCDTWGGSELLAQIPMTVRLHKLAARFATQRGQDPDLVITGAWGEADLWRLGAPATPVSVTAP